MDKIKVIAGHIRQADGVCFITGAGASVSAGVPTAAELVKLICDNPEYDACTNGLSKADRQIYGKVMYTLTPTQREALIVPLLEKAGISWGQIALANLISEKSVSRVLTFNFDLILEKASALLGIQPPVYDFGLAPTKDINRIAKSAIVHLHGQGHGLVMLNTEDETTDHGEELRPLLAHAVRNNVTVVIGYSGEADGAFKVICEEFNSSNRLIWLGYTDKPAAHLKPLLSKDYALYFGGCDFDLTMIAIAQELGIWPPAIISNPMQHLLDELSSVKAYPVQENAKIDVLSSTRHRLQGFSSSWDAGHSPDDLAFDKLIRGSADPAEIEKIRKRLVLEAQIKSLKEILTAQTATVEQRSHNNPPELVDEHTAVVQQFTIIWDHLEEIENEVAADEPSVGRLRELLARTLTYAKAFAIYCASLGDVALKKAAEEVGTTGAKWVIRIGVGYYVAQTQPVQSGLQSVGELLKQLIRLN